MRPWGRMIIIMILVVFSSLQAKSNDTEQIPVVKIPAGEIKPFWLAVLSKKKNKQSGPIRIKSFESMIYQVRVKDFKKFLEANPEWKKDNVSLIFTDEAYLKNLEHASNENAPITSVSWFAARAYCESVGMRLPTTNEWEYMAAASGAKKNASKDSEFLRRILDWYGEPQGQAIKPVGSIYKNLYGLWDMHGLVWEWVEDFNSLFVTGESREDSSFNKDMFCGAGGMSGANKEDYAAFMRFAFRSSLKGKSSVWNLGFRCVR